MLKHEPPRTVRGKKESGQEGQRHWGCRPTQPKMAQTPLTANRSRRQGLGSEDSDYRGATEVPQIMVTRNCLLFRSQAIGPPRSSEAAGKYPVLYPGKGQPPE